MHVRCLYQSVFDRETTRMLPDINIHMDLLTVRMIILLLILQYIPQHGL